MRSVLQFNGRPKRRKKLKTLRNKCDIGHNAFLEYLKNMGVFMKYANQLNKKYFAFQNS